MRVPGKWLLLLLIAGMSAPAQAAEESLYSMDFALETEAGETKMLAGHEGKPVLVSMFYSHCPHVCPMLVNTIQQVERQLAPEQRERLQVLMISVDPERDTPEVLAGMARDYRVDASRWTLARAAEADDTRMLAALLDIRYRKLPDGEFNHTSAMILLDEQGREVARSGKLGKPDPEFVARVAKTLRGAQ
ncbi:MAG TPA: SCO family protein [Gammaproteobacteria bacterium]|nr:SCO family protein [Gammaproteobacteria bacterium]